jgi:hypothetical protein
MIATLFHKALTMATSNQRWISFIDVFASYSFLFCCHCSERVERKKLGSVDREPAFALEGLAGSRSRHNSC